jgi:hypothetical protein
MRHRKLAFSSRSALKMAAAAALFGGGGRRRCGVILMA